MTACGLPLTQTTDTDSEHHATAILPTARGESAHGSSVYHWPSRGPRLAKAAIAAGRCNVVALHHKRPGEHSMIARPRPGRIFVMRHSPARLAQALRNSTDGRPVHIGPGIENGFFYDFELPQPSARMMAKGRSGDAEDRRRDLSFSRGDVRAETREGMFTARPALPRLILDELVAQGERSVRSTAQGDLTDLCRGRTASTGRIKRSAAHTAARTGAASNRGSSRVDGNAVFRQ